MRHGNALGQGKAPFCPLNSFSSQPAKLLSESGRRMWEVSIHLEKGAMPAITLLSETDLRACVALDLDSIACVEHAFCALATEAVEMPPILRLDIHERNGEVDVKTAYLPSLESFAIKVSPGFFDNPKIGLPSLSGMMMLLSAHTGVLEALLLDNGYLTSVRTAAAGAVAARWLAREDARRAAIIGAGEQARLQLQALCLVRPIESATIWAPSPARARACAEEMSVRLGIEVRPVASIDEAVAAADVVVTTTPSREPLIQAASAARHAHHRDGLGCRAKNEIAPAALVAASRYVCDRIAQASLLGELHHALDAGLVDASAQIAELGQIIAGQALGRASAQEVTICDLTGTGAQDTAIANLAHARALSSGRGTTFRS